MKHSCIFVASFLLLCINTLHAQKPIYLDETKNLEERIDDALARMTLDEKIAVIHAQSKFSSRGVPRLGFPDFWTSDGPHGVRPNVLWDEWQQSGQTNDSCVAFPALTCLAATWNRSLAQAYGKCLGEEAIYRGKDMILGPGVNIYRTPLNGRNFEYLGEDPFLAAQMAVPYIVGLQQTGVAACVKHFALNNQEYKRSYTNVKISDRALHEIYLPAFHAAVTRAHVWGIMGAYNLYKNQHCCENEYLLNNILKRDWNFDGVVLSDWGGTHNTDAAVRNGLDMEFGTGTDGLAVSKKNAYNYYYMANPFKKGIMEGKYPVALLDEKVRRVLRLFYRTTMNKHRAQGFLCSEEHYATARQIGGEGIVLLQNNRHVLPLQPAAGKTILVVGENAIKMMTVGGGSSSLKVQREVSPLAAIQAVCKSTGANCIYERGYVGDTTGTLDGVSTGQDLSEQRTAEQLWADAVKKARQADYVVFVGGLNKSKFQDTESFDRNSYDLPYQQEALINALAKVNKNLVYVNISGNASSLRFSKAVPAIVQAWYIGSEAGNAIADVLFGKVNPSGKLPFSWGRSLNDYGAHATNSYPEVLTNDREKIEIEYKEGIYVGYRRMEKFNVNPLFAFGHGLSYTTFKLSHLRKSSDTLTPQGTLSFTINVTNTGNKAGAEVVQLYINDEVATVDRPVKELKGFTKVYLHPGESKDVTITIDKEALGFWDEQQSQWKYEPGIFNALVGNASDNITLSTKFKLVDNGK